jgi:16S rRNA (adenine1518-N6/adenine1519-N6)-dimethyltransferase
MTRNKVQHLDCDENLFKRVVKTVFNQRRKMLRVSLRQLIQGPDDAPFATKRPEQLTVTDFVELTNWVGSQLLCANTKS